MSNHSATVHWQRHNDAFAENNYSRKHKWTFDEGLTVPASASPQVVSPRFVDDASVDPEEAFVASLSSCHMLWFLSFASKEGFIVDDYRDQATGTLAKNKERKLAITEVILRPIVRFGKARPDRSLFDTLHHRAHEHCFIAHSVHTNIIINAKIDGSS